MGAIQDPLGVQDGGQGEIPSEIRQGIPFEQAMPPLWAHLFRFKAGAEDVDVLRMSHSTRPRQERGLQSESRGRAFTEGDADCIESSHEKNRWAHGDSSLILWPAGHLSENPLALAPGGV